MEKALKILNRLKEQIVDSYTPPYNVEISYTEDFESDIVQAIGELEEAMKPKTCDWCDNNHKDRTIFYDGKKALMCTFCKYGAVSYFKPKNNA